MNRILLRCALVCSGLLLAFPKAIASEQPDCASSTVAEQVTEQVRQQMRNVTRVQLEMVDTYRRLLDQKSIKQGWSTSKRNDVVDAFLQSKMFNDLELQREPHLSFIREYRDEIASTAATDLARLVCSKAKAVIAAFEVNERINKRQNDLALEMLEAAD